MLDSKDKASLMWLNFKIKIKDISVIIPRRCTIFNMTYIPCDLYWCVLCRKVFYTKVCSVVFISLTHCAICVDFFGSNTLNIIGN
jgi:hypothetical protein